MVGGDSGTHFVIFGGCLRPQNTFLAFQMTKKRRFKAIFGAARGQAVFAGRNENHRSMATGASPGAPMAP